MVALRVGILLRAKQPIVDSNLKTERFTITSRYRDVSSLEER